MAEQSTVHRGWLTTRDGEKYAPATLISNVFAHDGTPYDTKVKQYIAQGKGETTESLESINNRINTLDGEVDTAVQRLDNKDSEIENKLANFGDDQDDTLFIIDRNSNVIAYIDENGVTSTNFTVPGATNFKAAAEDIIDLQERMVTAEGDINALDESLRNIGVDEDDDTFYIIDSAENVIAYVNKDGIHSINFVIDNKSDYLALLEQVEKNVDDIQKLFKADEEIRESIETLSNSVNDRLKNFDGSDAEAFYFVDGSDDKNVIAYIDKDGIHTTGLGVTEAGINVKAVLNIHDESGNVVAYIDSNGVHSSNFLIEAEGTVLYNLSTVLFNLNKTDGELGEAIAAVAGDLSTEITKRTNSDTNLQNQIDATNTRTQYLDATASDKLFIVDGTENNNVIAYIDSSGVHSVEFFAEKTDENGNLVILYKVNDLGDRIVALEGWRPTVQQQANQATIDIGNIYDIIGEETYVAGTEHKKRLDKIDNVLNLNSSDANGESTRLKRLDDLVGDADDIADAGVTASHEARIKALQDQITKESGDRDNADTALDSRIDTLEQKTEYLDASAADKFFIVDGTENNNVIGYFDANGLTIIDVRTKGLKLNANGTYSVVDANTATEYSLNDKLAEILTRLKGIDDLNSEEDVRLDLLEDRMGVQEKVTGETEPPAAGMDHKSRLDDIDDTLDLDLDNGDTPNGRSKRLDRLDNLVGVRSAEGVTGTHEDLINGLRQDLTTEQNRSFEKDRQHDVALRHTTNYLGRGTAFPVNNNGNPLQTGDLFTKVDSSTGTETAYVYSGSTWDVFEGLSQKLHYLNGMADDKFYIVDRNNNVVAYFSGDGLYVTDIKTQGIELNSDAITYDVLQQDFYKATPVSLNQQIHKIWKAIKGENEWTTTIWNKLQTVSNVMDFIGAFNTKTDLDNYENPNNGDVAIVLDTETEWVYCVDDNPQFTGWVELGKSTATATAIANLQAVVGRNTGLNPDSGDNKEKTHDERLKRLDDLVGQPGDKLSDEKTTHAAYIAALQAELATETEARLRSDDNLNTERTALAKAINYRGRYEANATKDEELGDIAVFGDVLKIYNETGWEDFIGLSKKLYYIDGTADDKMYFTDSANNVIAYIDGNGLTVTDVRISNEDGFFRNRDQMIFFQQTGSYRW